MGNSCGVGFDVLLAGFMANLNLGLESSATMLSDRFGASTRALGQTLQSEVSGLRSDLRVEIATLRRESTKAVTALLDDVAAQRTSLAEERRQFTDSKKLASDRDWLVLLGNGNYICLVCDTHHHALQPDERGPRFLESPFLRRNGGLRVGEYFSRQVCKHENTQAHAHCWQLEDHRQAEPLQYAFRMQEQEADEVTRRIFRTVLDSLCHHRSFLEHESLCFLQSENGLEMGDRLHMRLTAASMLETIYTVQREQARLFLVTPNMYTQRRPYVGIAADKVCLRLHAPPHSHHTSISHRASPLARRFATSSSPRGRSSTAVPTTTAHRCSSSWRCAP